LAGCYIGYGGFLPQWLAAYLLSKECNISKEESADNFLHTFREHFPPQTCHIFVCDSKAQNGII
jgi:hypothetical protein